MTLATTAIAAWMSSPMEWGVVLVVALLLFGKRLPDVMRSMGRGIVEFKRGVRGVEDDIESEIHRSVDTPKSADSESSSTKP